jgi:hypothetical protein
MKKDNPIAGLIGMGAVAMILMKYNTSSGTRTDLTRYLAPITGTSDWWIIKEKNKWARMRGSHFLYIYLNQIHNQLNMEFGPMFYYSTIKAPIL